MTKEQLKKLAEIAGLTMFITETNSGFIVNEYLLHGDFFCCQSDWQPHLRIEQAYLVESGIPGNKQLEYMCALQDIVVSDVPDEWIPGAGFLTFSVVHANANQRCHAALASAKE